MRESFTRRINVRTRMRALTCIHTHGIEIMLYGRRKFTELRHCVPFQSSLCSWYTRREAQAFGDQKLSLLACKKQAEETKFKHIYTKKSSQARKKSHKFPARRQALNEIRTFPSGDDNSGTGHNLCIQYVRPNPRS